MQREYHNNESSMFKKGLQLFNNTCFINTLIQCLCGCLPYVEFLFRLMEQYNSVIFEDELDFLQEYMRYMCGYNKYYPIDDSAKDFKYFIQVILFRTFRQFVYGQQQDIHEFFMYLHNYLEEACKLVDISIGNPLRMHRGVGNAEQLRLRYMFKNSIDNKMQCLLCNHAIRTSAEEIVLSVSLTCKTTSNNYSLNEALDEFFNAEEINDPNEYMNCESCQNIEPNRKSPYIRKFYLLDTPLVLVIQLKRFGVNKCFNYC